MANPIFSDPGVALATFLHTLGAIGYLGGITLYVAWVRSARRGHDNPSVLALGASLTYVSIIANLVGGFVRTYQPGHPSLYDFGNSTWATVMVVKHAALFAGIGAAVVLFELHAPRLRRMLREGLPVVHGRSARAMLATVVASILLASILGGASTVLSLAGAPAEVPGGLSTERFDAGGPYWRNGTVSAGQDEEGSFHVPFGTIRIEAVLEGPSPQGLGVSPHHYTLQLRDPTGASTSGSTQGQGPTDPRRIAVDVRAPASGSWTFIVSTPATLAAAYSLHIGLTGALMLSGTVPIDAGRSVEIDVEAPAGALLAWDWSADMHVAWNIHTHAGGFQTVVEGHAERDAGRYTTQQAGTYSYFWQAEEATRLTLRVWGDFEVASIRT